MRKYHSPSSTELGARCQRAWAYCYIDKLREPSVTWDESMAERLPAGVTAKQRSAALGAACHAVLEAWYDGREPAWLTYPGQVVEAGRHLLPAPDRVVAHVETPIGDEPISDPGDGPNVGFRFDGVLWAGFRDLVVTDAAAELARIGVAADAALIDYKTTSSIGRYAKDAAALTADLQCNLYVLATCAELGVAALPARWVYFETKKVRRALPVDVVVTRSRAVDVVSRANVLTRTLDQIERSEDAPMNTNACDAYGGCAYHESRGGPCTAFRSFSQLAQLHRKDESMALTPEQQAAFDKFKKPKADAAAPEPQPPPSGDPGPEFAQTPEPAVADAKPAPKPRAALKKLGSAPAPTGGIAGIVAAAQVEIAAAEAEIAAGTARRDAAVASLKAALA